MTADEDEIERAEDLPAISDEDRAELGFGKLFEHTDEAKARRRKIIEQMAASRGTTIKAPTEA